MRFASHSSLSTLLSILAAKIRRIVENCKFFAKYLVGLRECVIFVDGFQIIKNWTETKSENLKNILYE